MNRCGIIFVHGIVGNHKIFDFLKPLVPASFESKDIVLQGHGVIINQTILTTMMPPMYCNVPQM